MNKWDKHFLESALHKCSMSKDPSTKVGAVIVGPDREERASGFNGFPRGIKDTATRLADRPVKLKLVVHAEINAIMNAARTGVSTKGCTLYLAAKDAAGRVWGGPPCSRCAVEIIQSGITHIVAHATKAVPDRWVEDISFSRAILKEAGINYREVP